METDNNFTFTGKWNFTDIVPTQVNDDSQEYNIKCIVVHNNSIKLLSYNTEYKCWDDEDGDDFFCKFEDVDLWMYAPNIPDTNKK